MGKTGGGIAVGSKPNGPNISILDSWTCFRMRASGMMHPGVDCVRARNPKPKIGILRSPSGCSDLLCPGLEDEVDPGSKALASWF